MEGKLVEQDSGLHLAWGKSVGKEWAAGPLHPLDSAVRVPDPGQVGQMQPRRWRPTMVSVGPKSQHLLEVQAPDCEEWGGGSHVTF